MMRSLFSGVSGLRNHQTRMDVIGNNISNVNTTGFKSSRATFSDMLSQTLSGASAPTETVGGTNPRQIGLGSSLSAVEMIFTNGSVQGTGKNTDLCLSSDNSLFILNTPQGTAYTRNGAFLFDADGNYVQAGTGYYVQGWMANSEGAVLRNGKPGNIRIPAGQSMPPKCSTQAAYTNNLNSEVPTITKVSGGTPFQAVVGQKLTLSDGSVVSLEPMPDPPYHVGDTYGKFTITVGRVTVSPANSPVSVTLATGKVIDDVTADPTYKYGHETTAAGDSATASATQEVTVHTESGKTFKPTSGTYTVGDTFSEGLVTTGTNVVTGTAAEPLVLHLDDGTTHTITDGSSYKIGDTYTYPPGSLIPTATVTGYEKTYKIKKLDVFAAGANGSTIACGGFAEHEATSVTKEAENEVIVNDTWKATDMGHVYKVGDKFAYDKTTTNGDTRTADAAHGVVIELSDGTLATGSLGTTYKVGDNYDVTQNGVTKTLQIAGLSYETEITSLKERSKISKITTRTRVVNAEDIKKVIGSEASTGNPVTVTMSDGTIVTQTAGTFEVGHSLPLVTTLTVYDTLGGQHDVAVFFRKTGVKTNRITGETTSSWAVSLDTSNAVPGSPSTQKIVGADGTTTTLTMPVQELVFNDVGSYKFGTVIPTLTLTNGSHTPQTVQVDFSGLTQYGASMTIAGKADGYTAGTLSSVSLDTSGTITGTYTNGVKKAEAQVALQRFNNPAGLMKIGESLYQDSNNAGRVEMPNTAYALGAKLTPAALEMSNVDLAEQFTDMIVTQRGFQANSKIITVSDEMLETLVNMKR